MMNIEFKIKQLFDSKNDGHVALLRMLASCNDINLINMFIVTEETYKISDKKEIQNAIRPYLFRLGTSHLVEAKKAYSSFTKTPFGKDIVEKLKNNKELNLSAELEIVVDFFEKQNKLFEDIKDTIRNGVSFHYLNSTFKDSILKCKDTDKSKILVGETMRDTRYVVADEIISGKILDVIGNTKEEMKEKLDEITKIMNAINLVVSGILTIFLNENEKKYEST